MGKTVYVLLALFLIVGIGSAYAGSSVTSCTDPTTRADATPFDAATELDHYEWYVDDVYMQGQDTTSCAPFTLVAPGADGDKRVQAITVDTAGRRSALSPVTVKPFTTAAPNPPVVN